MWEEGVGSQDRFLLAEGIQSNKKILGPDARGVAEKQRTNGSPRLRGLHAQAVLSSAYVSDLHPATEYSCFFSTCFVPGGPSASLAPQGGRHGVHGNCAALPPPRQSHQLSEPWLPSPP